jgi:hypothetical protein
MPPTVNPNAASHPQTIRTLPSTKRAGQLFVASPPINPRVGLVARLNAARRVAPQLRYVHA